MVISKDSLSGLNHPYGHKARTATGLDQPRSLSSGSDLQLLGRGFRATNFGTLGSGDDKSRGGSVGRNDPDLFKFKLKKQRRVSLDVTIRELISSRYIRGSLLDSRERSLKTTDKVKAPFGSDDISTKLKPGTYFVKISTDGKKIFYNFRLSVD